MGSRPPPPRAPFDVDEACYLFRQLGSYAAVGRRMGFASKTVSRWLRPLGLDSRRPRATTAGDEALYRRWIGMRARARAAERLCGRVQTDPEWDSFAAFRDWARSEGFGTGSCFVRSDSNMPWGPNNCRVVSAREAARTNRTHSRGFRAPRWKLAAFGESKSVTEWSRDPRCAVTAASLVNRLRERWNPEEAITTPPARAGLTGVVLHPIRAFGQTKSVTAWAKDRRCKVSLTGLQERLRRGVPPEVAIRTPAWQPIPDPPAQKLGHRARR